MASNEGLNLAIGANLSGLTTGLDRAVNSLNQTSNTIESIAANLVAAFNSLQPAVNNTVSIVNNLSPVTAAAAAGITNLSAAITSGQASFTGLGVASTQASTGINTIAASATNAANSINNLSPSSGASAAGITNLANAIQSGQASFTGLGTATTQASAGLNNVTASATNTRSSINRLSPVSGAAAAGITNLSRSVTAGQVSLNGATLNANRLAPALNNINRPSNTAANSLQNLGRIASDSPFGFIAIQNNLDPLFESFRRLQAETGSTGGALKALGKSLMGAGGIALAFTVVSALITAAIQKYGSLGNAYDALMGKLSAAKQLQDEYNKAISSTVGAVAGEMSKLEGWLAVARDENISREQRLRAVKLIQKEYPDYLKNISLENINSKQTAESIDLMTAALIRQARVKGAQDLISKEQAKIFTAQNKPLKEQASLLATAQGALVQFFDISGTSGQVLANALQAGSGWKAQSKVVNDADSNIKRLQNTINELLKTDAVAGTLGIGEHLDETAKSGKTVADILKELGLELSAIDAQASLTGATFDSIANNKITALQKAFEDLVKLGLKPTSPEIQKIATQINSLSDKIIGKSELKGIQLFQFDGKSIVTAEAQLIHLRSEIQRLTDTGFDPASESVANLQSKYDILSAAIGNKPLFDVDNFVEVDSKLKSLSSGLINVSKAQGIFNAKIEEGITRSAILKLRLTDLVNYLNSSLQQAALDAGVALTEGIVNAASGKGIQSAMAGFANIFGGYLTNLGKQLIIYSGILDAIKVSIQSLNPGVAVAAGIAAIAAGQALKNYASKVPSFATGGLVTEPTLAMVGDNPGKKEAIIPSELWDKIGGGGTGFIAETRVGLTELIIGLRRAEREGRR